MSGSVLSVLSWARLVWATGTARGWPAGGKRCRQRWPAPATSAGGVGHNDQDRDGAEDGGGEQHPLQRAVRDSAGTEVARSRGLVTYQVLFDTLGDGQPGGEVLDVEVTGVHGVQQGTFDENLCDYVLELIGLGPAAHSSRNVAR